MPKAKIPTPPEAVKVLSSVANWMDTKELEFHLAAYLQVIGLMPNCEYFELEGYGKFWSWFEFMKMDDFQTMFVARHIQGFAKQKRDKEVAYLEWRYRGEVGTSGSGQGLPREVKTRASYLLPKANRFEFIHIDWITTGMLDEPAFPVGHPCYSPDNKPWEYLEKRIPKSGIRAGEMMYWDENPYLYLDPEDKYPQNPTQLSKSAIIAETKDQLTIKLPKNRTIKRLKSDFIK